MDLKCLTDLHNATRESIRPRLDLQMDTHKTIMDLTRPLILAAQAILKAFTGQFDKFMKIFRNNLTLKSIVMCL